MSLLNDDISILDDQFELELVSTQQDGDNAMVQTKDVQVEYKCDLFELLYFLDYYTYSDEYRHLVATNLLRKQFGTVERVRVHFVITNYNAIAIDRAW